MLPSLKKMRGDKKGWYKVSDLRPGVEIARPRADIDAASGTLSDDIIWDEIVSIKPVGREQVYDIEVEGTHNFVGNGIFAHNTYALRVNTMLAVTGEVHADSFTVPIGSAAGATSTSALGREIPPEVLTADGLGVDLYKLSTYNLATTTALAARMDAADVRVTSLEDRVDKLESGAVGTGSTTVNIGTGLASALEGFSVLIQKGIAQFNTLVFRQLVASKDADGTSSAGSVSILTGNTVAQVANSLVLPSTKIFVTFNSQITGSWWVSDKAAGSFRVVLSEAQTSDVSFDYFLVQTEGQIATSTPEVGGSQTSNASSGSLTSSTSAPVITLLGDNPLYLALGAGFTDPGVTVDDNSPVTTYVNGIEQADVAAAVDTSVEKTYIITYRATDAAGNISTAMRSVIVGSVSDGSQAGGSLTSSPDSGSQTSGSLTSSGPADTVAPIVTLNGEAAMQLTVGDTYTDPGATAADDVDGDLTNHINVSGAVDTAVEGAYTLTYSVTDAAGNEGHVSRLVTVVATAAPEPEPEPAPAPATTEASTEAPPAP